MARNTYFAFDFDDVRAANIVRNSNVVPAAYTQMAFRDHSLYERVKQSDAAIQKAIDEGVENTSVTVICTGGMTYLSRWVRYEVAKSLQRGNGLMVVHVDGIGLPPQPTKGPSVLEYMAVSPFVPQTILGGPGLDILEWNGASKEWRSFTKAPRVYNSSARYPQSFLSGKPYSLNERFLRRYHWNDIKMYFEMYLDEAAQDVDHRRR